MAAAKDDKAKDEKTKSGKKREGIALPNDALIVMPSRNVVLFPGIVAPLTIGRAMSIEAAQEAVRSERRIGILLQRDPATDEPTPGELHQIGTSADVLRYITGRDGGQHHLICRGVTRFRVREFLPGHPFLLARIEEIPT